MNDYTLWFSLLTRSLGVDFCSHLILTDFRSRSNMYVEEAIVENSAANAVVKGVVDVAAVAAVVKDV